MTPASRLSELCQPHWNDIASRQPVARIWRKDHTLWKASPQEITNRLGWLDLPNSMRSTLSELTRFGKSVEERGIRDVVLLGMGGSSLGAEVLRQVLCRPEQSPQLTVLDSTVPTVVADLRKRLDPHHTLFLVASKSGTTTEVMAFYRFFRKELDEALGREEAGGRFVAITDPGTPLFSLANKEGFHRTFINPADVGGRYSVLSYFGLVPAAALGLNLSELLMRAREMARACGVTSPRDDNPGGHLGMVMGCMAKNGRNKLSIVTSPRLASFALWAEQLVAESTGKEGKGILPVAGEPLGPVEVYGGDRLFVYLRLNGDQNTETNRHAEALEKAGHPVVRLDLRDAYDLGGEFFRWEYAVAVAGACLAINPFDQPNVAESKKITADVLFGHAESKAPLQMQKAGSFSKLLKAAKPGSYLALLVYARETPELNAALDQLRARLLGARKLVTTMGYGPRYLHSTGQLHKGGPNTGLFAQICAPWPEGPDVPGAGYDFGTLATAQAIGDLQALHAHERPVIRVAAESETELPDLVMRLA